MSSHINVERVGKSFVTRGARDGTEFVALDDVSLDVPAGEFVSLVGPSGCGKSTLLDLLAGLTAPSKGRLLLDDEPITGPGLDRGIVFQQYALLPWRTALGNVEFGLEAKRLRPRERRELARHHLDVVGLSGFGGRYPHELSGGMKQRVAIARSLAYDPGVLLMDEPFAALDAQTRDLLQEEVLRIWQRTGKTILFVTHGIDEAVYLGQRVAVMSARPGRIKSVIEVGTTEIVPGRDPRSSAAFVAYREEVWTLIRDEVQSVDPTRPSPAEVRPGSTTRRQEVLRGV
jgi:NitT/TauT family transport system ATP-binding protein